jgi:hypothetical protein
MEKIVQLIWLKNFALFFLYCVAGQGLGKLYNEVRSCHYEDVQVMWSMLQQSHHPLGSPKRRRITRSFQWWTGKKSPGIQLLVSSCEDVGGGKGLGSYNTVRSCHYEDIQVDIWLMLQQLHLPLGSPICHCITRGFQWWLWTILTIVHCVS